MSGTSIVYPFDIIKTQLQTMPKSNQSLLSSTVSAFQNIIKNNGSIGLYRGFSTCLVGIAPEKGIKLAVNDAMRDYFCARNDSTAIQVHQEVLAGCMAGLLQLVVTVPYELVKIRLQLQGNLPITQRKSAPTIIRELGPTGLYKGFVATLCRDLPFCMLFFPLYSNIKRTLIDAHYLSQSNRMLVPVSVQEPFHVGLLSGIIAGGLAGAFVTPADMLKTRIQLGHSGNKGLVSFAKSVIKSDGFAAFYRGWHTRVLVIAPLYGFVSLAFEVQKRWLLN